MDSVKVLFRLEKDDDGYPPADVESLWATPTGAATCRLDNIPFFVRGVSQGDEVEVRNVGGELWFARLVREGGNRTIRILAYDDASMAAIRKEVETLGCDQELSHLPSLLAVNAPPAVDTAALREWLRQKTETGEIDVDEACVDW